MLSGMWMCKWMGKWMCLWLRRELRLCRRVWGRDCRPGGGKFWFGVDVDDDALIYYARLRAATNNQVSNSSRNANENTQNDFLCPSHKGTRRATAKAMGMRFELRLLRERDSESKGAGDSLPCLLRCLPKLPAKWGKRERYRERSQKPANLVGWKNKANSSVGSRLARLRWSCSQLSALHCPSFTPLCGLSLWRVLQMNKRSVCRQSD